MNRHRVVAASVARVWDLVSDPYNLPRWWPRCVRVEDVGGAGAGERRARWTAVMETEKGRTVRADFRCVSAAEEERYVWEQEIEGSPFERILAASSLRIDLAPADDDGARVSLRSVQKLRGLSRLGSPMMRGGSGRNLDAALDGIEAALT
ncbi:MAG TPA: SRPBCC family protein [Solirubrobacterales bacterium]